MQYVMRYLMAVILLVTVVLSPAIRAETGFPGVLESRYIMVQSGPTEAQQYPLQTMIDMQIPQSLDTVGAAVDYMLMPHGFHVLHEKHRTTAQSLLALLPLPKAHRALGPIKLIDALKVVGGEAFNLVVNPVKRTVTYTLKPEYRQYVSAEEIEHAHHRWVQYQDIPLSRHYGPVKPGEYLSRIAITVGLMGMTLDQRMVQLYRANRDAFDSNMNVLRVRVMLSIPPADVSAVSASSASQLVDEHHRLWQQGAAP